jgi:hypothetical protein
MANKKELNKLTFDSLIAKKLAKEKNEIKFKEIEVPSLEGTLVFEKPLEEDLISSIDKIDDGKDTKSVLEAYDQLIYSCCPTLKDSKLQEQLGIKAPLDIVKTLFDMSDRLLIGNELVEFSGMARLSEKLKN